MNKTIHTPDGWHQVNIETFQQLSAIPDNENKMFETIAVLTDQDPEEIKLWDMASFGKVSQVLAWTNTLPDKKHSKVIDIEGERYGFIERLSSLTLGQWMDVDHYLNDSSANLHKLMALFYRPVLIEKNGKIIVESYDSATFSDRAELFREKMSIQDCYGSLLFFSSIGKESMQSIQAYFQKQLRMSKRSRVLRSLLGLMKKSD